MPGVAAYVRHQHLHTLYPKTIKLTERIAYIAPIHIAKHGSRRTKLPQRLQYLHRANVACMPYLVHITEMLKNTLIQISVSIAQKSYTSHSVCGLCIDYLQVINLLDSDCLPVIRFLFAGYKVKHYTRKQQANCGDAQKQDHIAKVDHPTRETAIMVLQSKPIEYKTA